MCYLHNLPLNRRTGNTCGDGPPAYATSSIKKINRKHAVPVVCTSLARGVIPPDKETVGVEITGYVTGLCRFSP